MRERIVASNNPNFLFMNYSLKSMGVIDLFIVPKHFFVPTFFSRESPLLKLHDVRDGSAATSFSIKSPNLERYFTFEKVNSPTKRPFWLSGKKLFLRNQSIEAKGWLLEVMKCVDMIGKPEFDLEDVYRFEQRLSTIFPNNQNVKPKIRQQLQYLRDKGYLEFVSRGNYRLRPKA